tara:strand:+ start:7077 stop:7496 length:420 start_codon:yes stop_codon:yes gene_type:complete
MFKKINFQFLFSYLGLFPFLIILLDKFFFKSLKYNIIHDFSIFYSIIIYVFIGAVNWNLKKNISLLIIFIGFMPSLASVLIIIMFLNSYEVMNYIIILFIIQLMLDSFIYRKKNDRFIFFLVRVPLTSMIIFFLIFIQL